MAADRPVGNGATPARIDEYELVQRVGFGPRAEAWLARSAARRDVVLKLFHPHLARQPGFLTLFEKETAALTAMAHPNVLGAIDRGKSSGQYYLVTELVRRGSLRGAPGKTPVDAAVTIGVGVCDALDYAHRRGVLHKNLVLDNVFLDENDRVRVADFNLSTLDPTSPARERPYDTRSDLRAVGSLLFQLITGARPTEDHVPRAPMGKIPPRLQELLARALSPAGGGFGRASELALALRLAARTDAPLEEDRGQVTFRVTGRVVTVTVRSGADASSAKGVLDELGTLLGQNGPWRIAYDLSELTIMDEGLATAIRRVHARHQRSIEKVAFCSPRGLVRSSALLVAGAVKELPWKMFAAAKPMQTWVEAAR